MNKVKIGVCYALAMLALAMAVRLGIADRESAEVILLVMPILALTQMFRGSSSCTFFNRAETRS